MKEREQWVSKLGFILATAGSAIGLGNIWKFPGKVGAYGGGAFILCYVLIVVLIGFPVMLAELSIGRSTQKNAVGAFRALNRKWAFVGWIGQIALFVIMSYYCIVGGWVLKYIVAYGTDQSFGTIPYQDYFVNFISQPVEPLIWGLVFLGICVFIIGKGVAKGIEQVSKFLMPVLFLLLIACVVRAVTLPGAGEGIAFMLRVDPSQITRDTLVGALGQAFFSLSVGMGIILTYGSYVPKKENLISSAAVICALDTLVAILAAFAIIPMVFVTLGAEGLGMGGGFAFMALPAVFEGIPGGRVLGAVFFLLLFLAALTSALSILETCVAFMTEEWHLTRGKAMALFAIPMSLFSAGYSLSQDGSRGINLPWFDLTNGVQMVPMNAVMERFTDNLMIPLGAFFLCVFTGWVLGTKRAEEEITSGGLYAFPMGRAWAGIIRFLAPAVILVILYFTFLQGQTLS